MSEDKTIKSAPDLFDGKLDELKEKGEEGPDIEYSFQEVGVQMEEFFDGNIWWIFYKEWAPEWKVREAFKICKKRGINKIPYLIGVIKNL